VASRPASVVRPDASSLPASAAWAAGAVAASDIYGGSTVEEAAKIFLKIILKE